MMGTRVPVSFPHGSRRQGNLDRRASWKSGSLRSFPGPPAALGCFCCVSVLSVFLAILPALCPEPSPVSTVALRQLAVVSSRSLPPLGQPL